MEHLMHSLILMKNEIRELNKVKVDENYRRIIKILGNFSRDYFDQYNDINKKEIIRNLGELLDSNNVFSSIHISIGAPSLIEREKKNH